MLQGFTAAPAGAADLNRAKTQLIACVTYRRDSQFALASAYGQALTIGLTVDDVNEWPARIRAVSAEGVRKAAQTLSRKRGGHRLSDPGERQMKRVFRCSCLLAVCRACLLAPVPARAADIQNYRSGQECAKSGSPKTTPFPSSPSVSRCRRVRPMTRPARRGWPSFAASLIDEGAGNLDSKRLP